MTICVICFWLSRISAIDFTLSELVAGNLIFSSGDLRGCTCTSLFFLAGIVANRLFEFLFKVVYGIRVVEILLSLQRANCLHSIDVTLDALHGLLRHIGLLIKFFTHFLDQLLL